MKKRHSFVSNSSSSSFVVIPEREVRKVVLRSAEEVAERRETIRKHLADEIALRRRDGLPWTGILSDGEKDFGWQTRVYSDISSKWNWMVLQACYGFSDGGYGKKTDEYRKQVDAYLASLGLDPIDWKELEVVMSDYTMETSIDHQSIDAEGTFLEICRIGIAEWLYNSRCFIENGNDNG